MFCLTVHIEDTFASSKSVSKTDGMIPTYSYKVVNVYPHDRYAFIQGLAFVDGFFYEGTGLIGRSSLRRVELETGNVLKIHKIADHIFGEGVTVFKDKIIQLTWKSKVGFVYDKESFRLLREFNCQAEGWGITHDGKRLMMSDGSAAIRFLDPESFKEIRRTQVHDENGPVERLNELEYVNGKIYANVWKTDRIAMISPDSGRVTGWIDLTGLLGPEDKSKPVNVLNGIAYDPENDRLFVTGKLWPKLFEIKLVAPYNYLIQHEEIMNKISRSSN